MNTLFKCMTSEYWVFEGKITRLEFCLFTIPNLILLFTYFLYAGYLLSYGFVTVLYPENTADMWCGFGLMLLDLLMFVYTLHIIAPCINVVKRRCTDIGITRPGTVIYVGFVVALLIGYWAMWFRYIAFIQIHIPYLSSHISGETGRGEAVIALFSFLFIAALPLMLTPSKHNAKTTSQVFA
jgi:uncharacterized membrane protein YhaH (DUF805 family)